MFTFAWVYALLLLPLLWVVEKFVPKKTIQEASLMVPYLDRFKAQSNTTASLSFDRSIKQTLKTLAWCCLVIACANPQWLGAPVPIKQEGRNIMLAVDLSRSMEIPDLQQNAVQGDNRLTRLQVVKNVAQQFIEQRQGDKIGLILFGSKAYLQTPLTFDHKTLSHMLDDATIGLAGDRTAIGDAVGLAIKRMGTEDEKSRILILLTDGGNNSGVLEPNEVIALAKRTHIKIYTVGLGADRLEVNGFFGSQMINPSADLDEKLLKKMAADTNGKYFRAQDDKTLSEILAAINQLEPISADAQSARPIKALFYWPLCFALVLFILLIFPYADNRVMSS